MNADGSSSGAVIPEDDSREVSVKLLPDDANMFRDFTESCIGGKILMEINREPIIAFTCLSAIPNGQFAIEVQSAEVAETLVNHLKQLQ
jgi:hypothetical protein